MLEGKIFYKGQFLDAGIEIEDGRIKKIGKLVKGKKVDGVILPAAIDVHVHFRDFAEKRKETIESGSFAALHGGVCLVVDQPNTKPTVDSREVYFRRMEKAEKSSYVDYALNLALTSWNAEKIGEIARTIAVKYFLPAIGEIFLSDEPRVDYKDIERARFDGLMTVHAEDPSFVEKGFPNFLFRKKEAEILAVKKCFGLNKKIYFCHISTKDAAELIYGKASFEVTPHHLLLNKDVDLGKLVNVNPPLRGEEDAEWLLKNFEKISVFASDHAPHTIEDKEAGAAGFPGVETTYPIFVYLAKKGLISFTQLVEKIASNPAKIFGFKGYGEIEVGNFANLAVFDLSDERKIEAEKLHSLCNWTPYEGFKAIFPKEVYLRGEEVLSSKIRAGKVLGKSF